MKSPVSQADFVQSFLPVAAWRGNDPISSVFQLVPGLLRSGRE